MELETLEIALLLLLLIIAAVASAVRYLRLPYPVALVLTGLTLGALLRGPFPMLRDLPLDDIHLTPEAILLLLLPALLFEATLHIEARALRQTLVPIGLLAVPGVLLNAAIVGALVHWGVGLEWSIAFLFGAIVAATDPVAVLAIFKQLHVPRGLELVVEGESLFNDGTAVVLARILQQVVLVGTFSVLTSTIDFGVVVGGGLIIGTLAGILASRITAQIDDHLIEITLTAILTYGTFLLAESIHVSGVIAVVSAGLVLGNVGATSGMSPTTRLALLTFWEFIAFLINSIIFLLIGLEVNLVSLGQNWFGIVVAIFAVLVARAVVVYGLGILTLQLPRLLPLRWLHALFWSGMRGAVSLAVVLALPFDFPQRGLLLDLTFGVVLFTLLAQGLTIGPVLRRLGLVGVDERYRAYNKSRAQLLLLRAGREELQRLAAERVVLSPRVRAELDEMYQTASERLEARMDTEYKKDTSLEAEEFRMMRVRLLRAERSALGDLQRQGLVDEDLARELAEVVDERLLAAQSDMDSPAADVAAIALTAEDTAALASIEPTQERDT